jgi:hypothetical protein
MAARWQKEFTRDPTLLRDFRLLVEHEKRRISARDKNPAPAPPTPAPPIREIAQAPRFVAPVIVAAPAKPYQGTAMALDVPRGPSLPFARGATVAPVVITSKEEPRSARPANPLRGTAMALDVPRGPALPFAGEKAKGEAPAKLGAPAPEAPKNAAARLGSTAAALDAPRGPDMPFPNAARPKRSKLGELASFELPKELRAAMGGAPPAEARPAPATLPPATPTDAPALTLEQHASLSLELVLSPEKSAEILARYRLTRESKEALDAHWRARIAKEPALRDAWQRAYAAYHEWLAKSSR